MRGILQLWIKARLMNLKYLSAMAEPTGKTKNAKQVLLYGEAYGSGAKRS
jgi:hypothetical protein